jgi:hypothetical protein
MKIFCLFNYILMRKIILNKYIFILIHKMFFFIFYLIRFKLFLFIIDQLNINISKC